MPVSCNIICNNYTVAFARKGALINEAYFGRHHSQSHPLLSDCNSVHFSMIRHSIAPISNNKHNLYCEELVLIKHVLYNINKYGDKLSLWE